MFNNICHKIQVAIGVQFAIRIKTIEYLIFYLSSLLALTLFVDATCVYR